MISPATGRAFLWAKSLLVVLALTLVAAACGDSDDDASGRVEPAPTVVAQDAAEAADPDVTDAPGSSESAAVEEEPPGDGTEPESAAVEEEPPGDGAEPEPAAVEESDDPTVSDDDAGAGSDEVAESDDTSLAPQRIVSISPTATEMAFAIGAGDRVVAVDQFSYFPDEAPVTDLDGWNPNVEAIASYDPDLVLMQTSGDVGASLEALGIEVWAHDAPFAFEDVYVQIEQLGEVTGKAGEAAAVVADMRAEIAELIAAAPDTSGLTYYHELDNTLYTVTSSTFIGQVYGLFGLSNIADPADADGSAWGYPQLSDEYLVDADPDVIFLADTLCCGQNAETIAARPGWDQLTAVQTGRIVELDDDVVSRWGPRLVDFIAAISDVLVSIGAAS
ncbi:MAG: ABC transporter substrate-binding protein [Acidimicrobiaceae bacterium]|nr:ABC transporter substrate-binding protein [Acidimicrobiaceae bacterium]